MNVFTGVAILTLLAVSVQGGITAMYKDNPKADKEWLRSVLRDAAKMAVRRLGEMRLSKDQLRSEVNDFVGKQAKHYVDSEEMPEPQRDPALSDSAHASTYSADARNDNAQEPVADQERRAPQSQVRDFRKDLDDLISLDQDLERS